MNHAQDFSSRRACIITETYHPEINGVAHTLAKFVEGLSARGYSISLVLPDRPEVSDPQVCQPHCDIRRVWGFPLPFYPDLRFGVPSWGFLHSTFKQINPQIVYIATQGPLGFSALRAARAMGIPVVTGFHTNFHQYLALYGLPILSRLSRCYLRWFHNASDHTIVPTGDLIGALNGLGITNSQVLSRGVDSDRFSPAHRCEELRRSWGAEDQSTVVTYVGRLAVEKNVELAIQSYLEIRQRTGNSRLVVVGDGPIKSRLEKMYNDPDIIFAGFKTGEDLARHYASADIFLFPSETETFGNVVLEALASGLGVVAYRYAAAKMHIDHRHSGLLAPFGDSLAFTKFCCELASDRLKLQSLRLKARESAIAVSWQTIIAQLESIFESSQRKQYEAFALPSVSPLRANTISTVTRSVS